MAVGLGQGKSGSAKPSKSSGGAAAATLAQQQAAGLTTAGRPTVRDRAMAAAQGLGQLSRATIEAGRTTRRASDATIELGRRARSSRAGRAAAGFGASVRQRAARDIETLRQRRAARAS